LTLTSPRDCIVLASITVTGVGVVKVLVLVMCVPVMTICSSCSLESAGFVAAGPSLLAAVAAVGDAARWACTLVAARASVTAQIPMRACIRPNKADELSTLVIPPPYYSCQRSPTRFF
jgi:lysylphosphatidylglycerol synthetase-like protein (DUF2156 family)